MSVPTYKGRTIPIVAVPPDWRSEIALRVIEHTNVLEALDTSEQRIQRFPRPLFGTQFTTTQIGPKEQGALRKLFEMADAMPMGVPLWSEAVTLAAAVEAGATDLLVTSTAGTAFSELEFVMLWHDGTWEVLPCDLVAMADTVPLTEGTSRFWPANAFVVPMAFGYCKRPDFAALSADDSSVEIEFEERFNIGAQSRRIQPPIEKIETEVAYSGCCDEITVSWTGLESIGASSVEILHAPSADGPWLWWGETRKAVSTVTLGNYFGSRWLHVRVQTPKGNITVAKFKPQAPTVEPPTVELRLHTPGDTDFVPVGVLNLPAAYTGPRTAAPYTPYQLPYGGGYTGLCGEEADTAKERIAAVSHDNRTDGAKEIYKLNLFSAAMVEVGWRYAPALYNAASARVGKIVRVNLSSSQPGVVLKYTFDGTDPSLTHGKASGTDIDPGNAQTYTPYVPYIVARAFKDGCQSAPVYIPIDTIVPQTIHVSANVYEGEFSGSILCAVWQIDEHGTPYIWISGNPNGIWPCAPDLGPLISGVIGSACGGIREGNRGHSLRRTVLEFPWFRTNPAFDFPYGPTPDASLTYGGGRWVCSALAWRTRNFAYSFDGSLFYEVPSRDDAFYLLSGQTKHTYTPTGGDMVVSYVNFPADGERKPLSGMDDNTGATNNLADTLAVSVPGYVYNCPGNTFQDDLTDVTVAITCAYQ